MESELKRLLRLKVRTAAAERVTDLVPRDIAK